MTQVSAVSNQTAVPAPVTREQPGRAIMRLPEPTLAAQSPTDLVGMMMAMMEKMGQLSVNQTETRLKAAQEQAREQLQKLLEQIAQSLETAREAQKRKDDGWFGKLVDAVADVISTVVGTAADFVVDNVTMPFDAAVAIAEGENVMNAIKTELIQLAENGDTADSVKGFVKGVLKFEGAMLEFMAKLGLSMAEAAAKGESVWDAMEQDLDKLWQSFKQEILENPEFWEIAGWIAKGVSLAMAAMSGGTLAFVAVAVFLLTEADNRYGLTDKTLGKTMGDDVKFVKLGLQVASAALVGYAATRGGADWGRVFQTGGAVVEGGSTIYRGIRMMDEGDRQADATEKQADIQETLNRLHQIQRLIEDLIASLDEDADSRKTTMTLGNQLSQTQAAMGSAAIMRA